MSDGNENKANDPALWIIIRKIGGTALFWALIFVFICIITDWSPIKIYKWVKHNHAIAEAQDQLDKSFHYYKFDKELVDALKRIDVSKCPLDYRSSFYNFVEATEEYVSIMNRPYSSTSAQEEKKAQFIKCLEDLDKVTSKYDNWKTAYN